MLIRIIDEEGETLAKADITKKTLTAVKKLITVKISTAAAQEVADLFNVTCVNLPPVRKVSETRKAAIAAAINDGVDFKELFRLAAESSFLNGKNDRGWKADFDFILKPQKRLKILEGGFSDSEKPIEKEKAASFNVSDLEAAAMSRYKK